MRVQRPASDTADAELRRQLRTNNHDDDVNHNHIDYDDIDHDDNYDNVEHDDHRCGRYDRRHLGLDQRRQCLARRSWLDQSVRSDLHTRVQPRAQRHHLWKSVPGRRRPRQWNRRLWKPTVLI